VVKDAHSIYLLKQLAFYLKTRDMQDFDKISETDIYRGFDGTKIVRYSCSRYGIKHFMELFHTDGPATEKVPGLKHLD